MNQPHSHVPHIANPSPMDPLFLTLESAPLQSMTADVCLQRGNRHYIAYLSHHSRNDLAQATNHYRRALELNPSLPEAYVKLGAALWEQGDLSIDVALDYCEIALKLNPDCSEAHLRKGAFLRHAGRLDEAVESFQLAIDKTPRTEYPIQARIALGTLRMQQAFKRPGFHWQERLDIASQGLSQWMQGCWALPSDQTACRILWTTLQTDINIVSVSLVGRLMKTFGFRTRVVAWYEWASRKMPEEAIFHHRLGDLAEESWDLEGAIQHYQQAQSLDPDNSLLHKKLGLLHCRRNESDEAVHYLEKSVERGIADFESRYNLAQLYTEKANYMRALYHYKDLLNESPRNPYLHSNMAYVLFRMEDYDGAIRSYHTAVEWGRDPLWTSTIAQTLGTLYYQVRNDLEAAEQMLQTAFQLDSGNLECLTLLGDIYTEQGRYEEAIETYQYLLAAEPDNADCCNYMGYLLWQLERHDEAVGFYQRALELKADNPIAYNNLGVIFLDEKCVPEKALSLFEKAVELKTDYTLAHFNIARTLEAMGETAAAARRYCEAREINKQNPELNDAEIQERLTRLFEV